MPRSSVLLSICNHPLSPTVQSETPREITGCQRGSYVPEYVRRPRDFICYTLEEPIVVGSGNDGSSALDNSTAQAAAADFAASVAGGQREEGTAAAAQSADDGSAAQEDTVPAVPERVAFVPRNTIGNASRGAAAGSDKQAQPPRMGAKGISATLLVQEEDDGMDAAEADEGSAADQNAFKSNGPMQQGAEAGSVQRQRRKMRARSGGDDADD